MNSRLPPDSFAPRERTVPEMMGREPNRWSCFFQIAVLCFGWIKWTAEPAFFLLFPTCDVHVMSCRRGEYPDIGYPPFSCVNTHLRASVRLVYTLGCKDQRNEKETEDMLTRDGKQYYKAQEAAKLAGVNARTLSRWIAAGQLAHFLFPFRESPGGPLYYRLEPPDETDTFGENRRGQNGPIFPLNRSVGTDISPKSVRFVKIDQVDGDKMQVDGDKKGGCLSPCRPG